MSQGHLFTFNPEKLSKENAKSFEQNNLKWKEFWKENINRNIYDLQSVLDVLYNDENQGVNNRIYVGEKQTSQNSTRLVIKCLVCNKVLSSYDPFMGHNNGSKHKKAVQQNFNQDNENPNLSAPLIFRSLESSSDSFAEGSLEDQLANTSHTTVLGYQFMYKIAGEEIYSCQLCFHRFSKSSSLNKDRAFQHILSESHYKKFVEVKYGIPSSDQTDEMIQNIVQKEGKITAKIFEVHDISAIEKISKRYPEPKISHYNEALDSSKRNQFTQTENIPENVDMFMSELLKLKSMLAAKKYDDLVVYLKNDQDAYDLIIVLLKVLALKFFQYSNNFDISFLESSRKLVDKTNQLKIPPLE